MNGEQFTDEQLEQMLAERRKKAQREKEQARKLYEKGRDIRVEKIIDAVVQLSQLIAEARDNVDHYMEENSEMMLKYGDIPKHSKGGFTVTHSNGNMRVRRKRRTTPQWDERADMAEGLLREFLNDTIKKRDQKLAEVLMGFLTKNQEGDFRYSSVMSLKKHRDKWSDERWIKGLDLLEESFSSQFSKYTYEFQIKDKDGSWVNVEPLEL